MNDLEIAFWQMVGEVTGVMERDVEKFAALPEIARAVASLKVLQKAATGLLVTYDRSAHGYVADKDDSKALLIEDAMPVLTRIQAYARQEHDGVLLDQFNYTRSGLDRMIEAKLPDVVEALYIYGNANKAALEPLGLTGTQLDDLLSRLTTFRAKLPGAPRYLGNKRGGRVILKQHKADAYALFDTVLDPMMEIIRTTDPEAYEVYRTARKLKKPPTRHRIAKGDATKDTFGGFSLTVIARGTGNPLVGAGVQVEGENSTLLTDEEGQVDRDDVAPGTITLLVTMQGFVDVIKPGVSIVAGEITEVEVEMDTAG